MKVQTRVAAVVTVTVGMVCRMSGQQAAEGAKTVRDAFPVPATVRVVHDLVYAEYAERRLKLDLYLPSESGGRGATPAVIVVRGGGWRSGDKEAFGFIAASLPKKASSRRRKPYAPSRNTLGTAVRLEKVRH